MPCWPPPGCPPCVKTNRSNVHSCSNCAGSRSPGSRPTVTPARKTNLPAPLTSFVGRTQELAEVAQCITAQRLVTLTGAGGVGKTRLAVEAGLRLMWGESASAFADGVWLVELAALARGPWAQRW